MKINKRIKKKNKDINQEYLETEKFKRTDEESQNNFVQQN